MSSKLKEGRHPNLLNVFSLSLIIFDSSFFSYLFISLFLSYFMCVLARAVSFIDFKHDMTDDQILRWLTGQLNRTPDRADFYYVNSTISFL